MGKFDYLNKPVGDEAKDTESPESTPDSSTRKGKHVAYNASVDESLRPIYAASRTTYNTHSNNGSHGSDSTNYTGPRMSLDVPMPNRPSFDRARPSFDRLRASMDASRPNMSFEASRDITSANRLSKIESTHSAGIVTSRFQRRLRGLSLTRTTPN